MRTLLPTHYPLSTSATVPEILEHVLCN